MIMRPLGIRNNNPLNIRFSIMNKWKGQTGSNRGFCTFDTMEHGYRAALVLLHNYVKHGYDTVDKIISRWAPASENDTKAYIRNVVTYLRNYPFDTVEPFDDDSRLGEYTQQAFFYYLFTMCWCMSLVECGMFRKLSPDVVQMRNAWQKAVSEYYASHRGDIADLSKSLDKYMK